MTGGYKIRNQSAIHFVTFSVIKAIDVFTKARYRNIVLESLRFCQVHKGLSLHSWCLMSNHIHMVMAAKNDNLSDILRDFKKFTSKSIINSIIANEKDRRQEWMIELFKRAGGSNIRNEEFQFWQQGNHPIELYSREFILQKINYIHRNPVKAQIVAVPHHYLYSSARDYHFRKQCGILEVEFL